MLVSTNILSQIRKITHPYALFSGSSEVRAIVHVKTVQMNKLLPRTRRGR